MSYLKNQMASSMDMRDVLRIFFKRWWIMPIMIVISLIGGYLTLQFMTPQYASEVRLMFIAQPRLNSPFYDSLSSGRADVNLATTQSNVAVSGDILREVVTALKLQDREDEQYYSSLKKFAKKYSDAAIDWAKDMRDKIKMWLFHEKPKEDKKGDAVNKAVDKLNDNVKAEEIEKTDVFKLTVSDYDSETAAKIANVTARTFILFSLRDQLEDVHSRYGDNHPLARQLNDDISRIQSRLTASIRAGEPELSGGTVKIIQHAYPAAKPSKPKKMLVWGVAAASGILGGFFLIFLLEQMDPTYRGIYDLKGHVNVPFLGAVPMKTWGSWKGLRRKKMEDYLIDGVFLPLAYQIQSLRTKNKAKTICFSGAETTDSNLKLVQLLALALSKINKGNKTDANGETRPGGVLLVESSSFGRSSFFGQTVNTLEHKSMREYFKGNVEAKQVAVPVTKQLAVATLGHLKNGSSTYAYEEEKCREFLAAVSDQYDLVVFRGPDFSQRAEFLFLNTLCDATVVVVNEEQTRRKVLESMLETFELNDVKVLGTIMNDQKFYLPSILYSLM